MPRHEPRTIRRARRIARLAGAVVGVLAGLSYAAYLIPNSGGVLDHNVVTVAAALAGFAAFGLICGVVFGPTLSVTPYLWIERTIDEASPGELVGGALGLIVALVAGALLSVLLLRLPDGLGLLLSLAVTGVFVSIGVSAGARRRGDLSALAEKMSGARAAVPTPPSVDDLPATPLGAPALLDTSVLIDGRVLDVARTGFLPPRLLIPGFVLEELQRVADSGEPLRRVKGRRGLATVEGLQQLREPRCEIVDVDFPGVPEVDSRLLRLARARGASLMTQDFMLNRLAQIEGIRVLNINDLALALKPIVSAGETMQVAIVKEGKELHQGVGYLEDGTMVVVENGRHHLDETVTATVTSVIQTPAGRMIFAAVPAREGGPNDAPRSRVSRPTGVARPRVVGR